jgi:predicted ferric reductase
VPETITRHTRFVGRRPARCVDEVPAGEAAPVSRPARSPRAWARGVWWSVAIGVNLVMAGFAVSRGGLADCAVEASLVNFIVAVAARHDGVVRGAFVLGRLVRSYRVHQLTYHLGQFHRAMAIAGTCWFAVAIAFAATGGDAAGRAIAAAVLSILLAMIWSARDRRRHARHDLFEVVHRYGGWTALALLTALVLRQAATSAPPDAGLVELLAQPPVLLLLAVVALVVHPWLGVRRLPVEIVTVTEQVIVVALPGRRSRGQFVRVSRDGREWHCFAVATTGSEGAGRYCLVIRRAGDWTEKLARDAESGRGPRHLLVRRMRGHGFMYHAQIHRRVLIVATGAGIGPVLPYLLEAPLPWFDCLWIGRDHRAAVGGELVERVLAGGRVTLIDSACGRPDIGALVAAHARRFEAVFVVGNEQVRDDVARVCQRLDVPWYGPTFDS